MAIIKVTCRVKDYGACRTKDCRAKDCRANNCRKSPSRNATRCANIYSYVVLRKKSRGDDKGLPRFSNGSAMENDTGSLQKHVRQTAIPIANETGQPSTNMKMKTCLHR